MVKTQKPQSKVLRGKITQDCERIEYGCTLGVDSRKREGSKLSQSGVGIDRIFGNTDPQSAARRLSSRVSALNNFTIFFSSTIRSASCLIFCFYLAPDDLYATSLILGFFSTILTMASRNHLFLLGQNIRTVSTCGASCAKTLTQPLKQGARAALLLASAHRFPAEERVLNGGYPY